MSIFATQKEFHVAECETSILCRISEKEAEIAVNVEITEKER